MSRMIVFREKQIPRPAPLFWEPPWPIGNRTSHRKNQYDVSVSTAV
ncbi:hypothetical protein FHX76_002723 [Lysinibacter cavernae]|uniref:Uncharacterized protein n=1 Tax=Lysinibacter cavernae TaxID=1640652 RepID=A0A7X5R3R7_9MICO|nr:hypothetical protein [Lysinibacter cavernae]